MKTQILDIETRPNEARAIALAKPFDPSSVLVGNLKDPEKITAKIEESREKHETATIEKAALDPFTSDIIAIGIHLEDADQPTILDATLMGERDVLKAFWNIVEGGGDQWAFWSGSNDRSAFDLRHIIVRSRVNRVPFFSRFAPRNGYLPETFIDLAAVHLAFAGYPSYCGLNTAAKQYDLIGTDAGFATVVDKDDLESSGVTGKDFHKLWCGDDADARELATRYLINDLAQARAIANIIL